MPSEPATNTLDRDAASSARPADGCVQFARGGVRWIARPDCIDQLFDANGLRLNEWLSAGRAQVIKTGTHRTVYRLQLADGGYYLKHYRVADWKTVAQNLARPCRAMLELHAARCVSAAGIETFEDVAMGSSGSWPLIRDNFLMTREIADTEPLDTYLIELLPLRPAREQARLRQAICRRLGEMTARLHTNDLLHRDLHAGNVLVRAIAPFDVRLWLIDLHTLLPRRRLGIWTIERNLSMLNNFFSTNGATRADRLRFFRAYWAGMESRLSAHGDFEQVARRFEKFCSRALLTGFTKRDEKWRRGNRRLIIADGFGRSCRGVSELGRNALIRLRNDPESLFSPQRVVRWITREEQHRSAVVQLEVGSRTILARVTARLTLEGYGTGWAQQSWEGGHALQRRLVPTVRPLLFVSRRVPPGAVEYLVTEERADAISMIEALRPEHRLCRRELADALARGVRRMHDTGITHSSLTLENLLFARDRGEGGMLGLGNVHAGRKPGLTARSQDLSRLHHEVGKRVSLAVRARFLKTYLGPAFDSTWKNVWRSVATAPPDVARRRFLRAAALSITLAGIVGGCRSPMATVALPSQHSVRSDQLLVLSDIKLPQDHALIQELVELRRNVGETLSLPLEKGEVVVYLFSTEEQYREYLGTIYPDLPPRRAYFVGTPRELAVYTFWGRRIQEDLRHEYTHGLLHAALGDVPLWLDEGLAEYFEVPASAPGRVHAEHSQRLAKATAEGWSPNLKKLEGLDDFAAMQRAHYEESWAWVHFMLHNSDETRSTLLTYLHDLESGKTRPPLSRRLENDVPNVQERFASHLATMPATGVLVGSR